MPKRRLLLLSNSRNHGQGFLDHAEAAIRDFLGDSVGPVAFIPFAGVTIAHDEYARLVRERFRKMGYEAQSIHDTNDAPGLLGSAGAIAVGGGNTFRLVEQLHETGLMDVIRSQALSGVPYLGWSAGANVACPTLRTTNDMPIVEPPSFATLDLVPFQINPHYLDAHPSGHAGETRAQRIEEFIALNDKVSVVGLREGSILRVEGNTIALLGDKKIRVFRHGEDAVEKSATDSLEFLLAPSD